MCSNSKGVPPNQRYSSHRLPASTFHHSARLRAEWCPVPRCSFRALRPHHAVYWHGGGARTGAVRTGFGTWLFPHRTLFLRSWVLVVCFVATRQKCPRQHGRRTCLRFLRSTGSFLCLGINQENIIRKKKIQTKNLPCSSYRDRIVLTNCFLRREKPPLPHIRGSLPQKLSCVHKG